MQVNNGVAELESLHKPPFISTLPNREKAIGSKSPSLPAPAPCKESTVATVFHVHLLYGGSTSHPQQDLAPSRFCLQRMIPIELELLCAMGGQ